MVILLLYMEKSCRKPGTSYNLLLDHEKDLNAFAPAM